MKSQTVELQPDDLVLFYTDGVTEAFNAVGNLYGDARLLDETSKLSGCVPAEATAAVLRSVRAHAGNHPQSDDIAVLALKRKP